MVHWGRRLVTEGILCLLAGLLHVALLAIRLALCLQVPIAGRSSRRFFNFALGLLDFVTCLIKYLSQG